MVRLHIQSWSRRWIRDHYPEVAVRLGLVNGVTNLRKFGKNPDVDITGLPETVWNDDGLYPFQAGTFSLEVLSSSTEDGAGGSTGALTLTVQGLAGTDWLLAEETVTLNGTGIVTFARTDWRRVFRAFVVTAGSAGSNVGTITIRLASAGATQAVLSADRGADAASYVHYRRQPDRPYYILARQLRKERRRGRNRAWPIHQGQ
jgi:hypothetical protein